jgi:hypothetical protein
MLRRYNLASMWYSMICGGLAVYETQALGVAGWAETGKKATSCVFALLSFEGATGMANDVGTGPTVKACPTSMPFGSVTV